MRLANVDGCVERLQSELRSNRPKQDERKNGSWIADFPETLRCLPHHVGIRISQQRQDG